MTRSKQIAGEDIRGVPVGETTVQARGKHGRALGLPAHVCRHYGLELGNKAEIVAIESDDPGQILIVYRLFRK